MQRQPSHDRHGRVHSSTVTVACWREDEAPRCTFDPNDCEITFFSGTGPGGQHRNKTQNSARIRHRPTGIVRQAQTRSRENSVQEAMAALQHAVEEHAARLRHAQWTADCQAQRGSGERSDKRRTYRYQEGIVHDHLLNTKVGLSPLLKGDWSSLWK